MVYVQRVRVRDEVRGYGLISLIERRWSTFRGSECGMIGVKGNRIAAEMPKMLRRE